MLTAPSNQDRRPIAGPDLELAKRIAEIGGHAILRLKNGSGNRIIQGSEEEATQNPKCSKTRADKENSKAASAEYEKTSTFVSKSI